jgi:WD40 repeat protein
MEGGELGDKDDGEQKIDDSLKEKMEREMYKNYLAEGTPWFLTHPITCVADLANINYLATGCYDKNIYLWDLRNSSSGSKQNKGQESQKGMSKTNESSKADMERLAGPVRILQGHQKAVRDIAYSEKHKAIISCGFDFEVYVWNPYVE